MSGQDKDIVWRLYDETFNKGNEAAIDELMSPNLVDHDTGYDPLSGIGEESGLASIKTKLRAYRAAFPDLHLTFDDQVVGQDGRVVSQWTARGTQDGPLGRIPPTGKPVVLQGVFINRLVDGKVVEEWTYLDNLSLLMQLGVIPNMQPASAVVNQVIR